MTSKQTHSDASGSRRMAWMDWFGLIALGLLMVCSLAVSYTHLPRRCR